MKLLIFVCESAQKCIISHKIPKKIYWETPPLLGRGHPSLDPTPLGTYGASTPHLRHGLDIFGVTVSAPWWLQAPTVKILAMSLDQHGEHMKYTT